MITWCQDHIYNDGYGVHFGKLDGTQKRKRCKHCTLLNIQKLYITTTSLYMTCVYVSNTLLTVQERENMLDALHVVDDLQRPTLISAIHMMLMEKTIVNTIVNTKNVAVPQVLKHSAAVTSLNLPLALRFVFSA